MAVSIDTVYQKVLTIANKEQRGYITPQEFNLLADQAQLDILEQYFYDLNQFLRVPGNGTEYSDIVSLLNEKISVFEKADVNVASGTDLPSDVYRLGTVYHDSNVANYLTKKQWQSVKNSPLAAPTLTRPVYIKDTSGIKVYTSSTTAASADVTCDYIKKPAAPTWAFTTVYDNPLYNASTSVDFQLHPSEGVDLVIKILALAGIILEDPGLYQIASTEESKGIQQEKQ